MSTSRRRRTPAPPAVPATVPAPLTPEQVAVLHKVYAILLAHATPAGTP